MKRELAFARAARLLGLAVLCGCSDVDLPTESDNSLGHRAFPAAARIVTTVGGGNVEMMWGSGTATVNGIIDVMEWGQAESAQFTVNFPNSAPGTGTYHVMNDANNVYIAVEIPRRSMIDDQTVQVNIGDDALWVNVAGFSNPQVRMYDLFVNPANLVNGVPSADQDTAWGGTHDGSAAAIVSGATTTIEIKHPLKSGDARDLSAAPGDLFRFSMSVSVGPGFPVLPTTSHVPAGMVELNLLIDGTPLFSAHGSAVVDGVIDANDDWSAASCQTVFILISGVKQPARKLCVMNDAQNLYVSLDPTGSNVVAGDLSVDLDSNQSHVIDDGDDIVSESQVYGLKLSPFFDGWWSCSGTCTVSDANGGGAAHGAGAFTTSAIEIAHPLDSGDARDIKRSLFKVAGVRLRATLTVRVFLQGAPGQPSGWVNRTGSVVFPTTGLATIYLR